MSATDTREVVHIAGLDVTVGDHMRQRCAWCGAVLEDVPHIGQVMVAMTDPHPDNEGLRFPVWEVGALVAVDGGMKWAVTYTGELPGNACTALDPEVTT